MNTPLGGLDLDGVDHRVAAALELMAARINQVYGNAHLFNGHHTFNKTQGALFGGAIGIAGRGELRPPTLTANTNNYNPADLATATIVYLQASGAINLTGLMVPDPTIAWLKLLVNKSSSNITLVHNDTANSAAYNVFVCPGSANLVLNQNDGVWVSYDTFSKYWHVVGV